MVEGGRGEGRGDEKDGDWDEIGGELDGKGWARGRGRGGGGRGEGRGIRRPEIGIKLEERWIDEGRLGEKSQYELPPIKCARTTGWSDYAYGNMNNINSERSICSHFRG